MKSATKESIKSFLRRRLGPKTYSSLRNGVHNRVVSVRQKKCVSDLGLKTIDARVSYPDIYERRELYTGNDCYGHANLLKKYSGYEKQIFACIEHGVYFGGTVFNRETAESGLPGVVTFGEARRQHIRETCDKPVLTVGPYIQYAEPLMSSPESTDENGEHKSVLTVFPQHSVQEATAEYEFEGLDRDISLLALQHEIEEVRVCLFFLDVLRGLGRKYEQNGYRVVCAGHNMDPLFLPRLRSIIEQSDLTASNGVGTHVGYSVALGVPHLILSPAQTYSFSEKEDERLVSPSARSLCREEEIEEVVSVFRMREGKITDAQKHVVQKYWGLGIRLSSEEMRASFDLIRRGAGDEAVWRFSDHRATVLSKQVERRLLEDMLR